MRLQNKGDHVNNQKLAQIIESHQRYLAGKEGGDRAVLTGADLHGINLSSTDLRQADLTYADLRGTNLRYADLRGTNLLGANMAGADITFASLDSATRLPSGAAGA